MIERQESGVNGTDAGQAADWARDAVFYHIYPLGLLGAPARNDPTARPVSRLPELSRWIEHLIELGVTALYLGPVFESTAHGYDTIDYRTVDRRLGTNEDLARFVAGCHAAGIRVVLDAVFNHVGRDFPQFRDVRERGEASPYAGWFGGLRFDRRSPFGDPFGYEGWNGNFDLVKLDVRQAAVREHLFGAVESWIREFDIDGLRLDAADVLDLGFLRDLAAHARALRPDVWLLGEVVHGDYTRWANPVTLDSVTNYECYKGLWSSLVDRNYFEIAYALTRQFGPDGIYRDLRLYSFADNHDVDRVASSLRRPEHLRPLYALLFTMPGIPSVYYGSEWGIAGQRTRGDDRPLRPALDLATAPRTGQSPDLASFIGRLARIRAASLALRRGSYRQLSVSHEQLVFQREVPGERVIVVLNASADPAPFDVAVSEGAALTDYLDPRAEIGGVRGRARGDVPAASARILREMRR